MTRLFFQAGRGVVLLLFLAILSFSSAPYLLNTLLLPHLLGPADPGGISIRISQLSPWSLHGTVTLPDTTEATAAPIHVSIAYRPSELLRGKISAVTLDGGTVRLEYAEGKVKLASFSFPADKEVNTVSALTPPSLPVRVDALVIRNTQILFAQSNRPDLLLTARAELAPEFVENPSGGFTLKALQAKAFTQGIIPGSWEAGAVFTDENLTLNVTAHLPEVTDSARLLPLPEQLRVKGRAQIDGEIIFPYDFQSVHSLNVNLRLPGFQIAADGFTLSSSEQEPLTISASGTDALVHYAVKHLTLNEPAEFQAGISGTFRPATGELTGSGELHAALLPYPAAVELQGRLDHGSTDLHITLLGAEQQQRINSHAVLLGAYRLGLNLKTTPGGLAADADLNVASLQTADGLRMENITGELPFSLNGGGEQPYRPGRLVIDRIRYKNSDLAGLAATLEQTSDGLQFTGDVTSHAGKPLRLTFTGKSSAAEPLSVSFNLPRSPFDHSSLPSFAALPQGLEFSGRLEAKGLFTIAAGKAGGELAISVNDGAVDFKEKKIHLDGIAAGITLPALPRISSLSHQQLKIASMHFGKLRFTDGNIFFRIEDQQTLFIEKSRFTWCNGKVESGSLEISLINPELSTTLYCDRLQFSELLSQLGITGTEGDGSLNGRLPLHFTGKEMVFDDGFLFSTPGNSGIVRFNNTALLRQGLPETGQTAYLEYSMQALENFSYNWTKLTFNSKGDDLLISMEIDGKPATPLPFGYQNGRLAARADGPGIQHPIRLDVNFHLPFTQMFKYGQQIQKIMEKN